MYRQKKFWIYYLYVIASRSIKGTLLSSLKFAMRKSLMGVMCSYKNITKDFEISKGTAFHYSVRAIASSFVIIKNATCKNALNFSSN